MALSRCDECGVEEYMPFVCKFCRGRYCVSHRLPENHKCAGLEGYRERMRQEGRMIAPEPDLVAPSVSASARFGASIGGFFDRYNGKIAYGFLAIMVGVLIVQFMLRASGLHGLERTLFILDSGVLYKPWTVLTSVFAHAGFYHIFANGIMLFFFGPTLERLIGPRRFAYLFLGGGVAAGLLQLVLVNVTTGGGILGASGAVLTLLGCLTILAPKITVLVFFVIPAPLWAITAFYAVLDILGIFGGGGGIAHVAHLGGLAIGLYYGRHLKSQGLRVQTQRPQSMHRRYF